MYILCFQGILHIQVHFGLLVMLWITRLLPAGESTRVRGSALSYALCEAGPHAAYTLSRHLTPPGCPTLSSARNAVIGIVCSICIPCVKKLPACGSTFQHSRAQPAPAPSSVCRPNPPSPASRVRPFKNRCHGISLNNGVCAPPAANAQARECRSKPNTAYLLFDRKKVFRVNKNSTLETHPPGGVSCLLCSLIKNRV